MMKAKTLLPLVLIATSLVFCKLGSDTSQDQGQTPVAPPDTGAAAETPAVESAVATPSETPGKDPKLARNFEVIFDSSGSMRERKCNGDFPNKYQAAQWAFNEFLGAVDPDANLGLITFDRAGLRTLVPLGPGTRDKVKQGVASVDPGENTPLGPAVDMATAALKAQQEKQLGYGEYNLVVVTDGQADDLSALRTAVRMMNKAGILLHTIGFCIGTDNDLRSASYSYRTASNPEELKAAVLGVLAESEDFQPVEFEKIR